MIAIWRFLWFQDILRHREGELARHCVPYYLDYLGWLDGRDPGLTRGQSLDETPRRRHRRSIVGTLSRGIPNLRILKATTNSLSSHPTLTSLSPRIQNSNPKPCSYKYSYDNSTITYRVLHSEPIPVRVHFSPAHPKPPVPTLTLPGPHNYPQKQPLLISNPKTPPNTTP